MKNRLLIVAATLLLLTGGAFGQAQRTGRSVGLAGSGATAMYGSQAVGWNPANLGLKANPGFSITLASIGMSLGNNAFSPQYISDNFVEGDTLDSTQIEDIISQMGASKLDIYTLLGVPAFGLSIGRYAVNLDVHVLGSATIPADIFELVMTGPKMNVRYDLSTVDEMSFAYATGALSAAQPLHIIPFMKEFSVGASFKYIQGVAYGELEHKEGSLQITNEAVHADGFFRTLNSTTGSGVGLDLGVAGQLGFKDIYVGATIGNLIGSITWDNVEASETQFFRNEGLDPDSLTEKGYWRHFLDQTDTTYAYGSVKTDLPRYLLLSADLPYLSGKGDLFCSYFQGLNETPGQNTTPRLSFGTEFRWVPVLPLRLGVALGGMEGSEFSAGFGLRLLGYQMNLGASWQHGMLASARGFSLAFTNYFGPGFKRN